MSEEINDGGQAFPLKGPLLSSDNLGMTLRDYFAAKAMQSMTQYEGCELRRKYIATQAYKIADEMIKERESNG